MKLSIKDISLSRVTSITIWGYKTVMAMKQTSLKRQVNSFHTTELMF